LIYFRQTISRPLKRLDHKKVAPYVLGQARSEA
jgi:hypothetical protein